MKLKKVEECVVTYVRHPLVVLSDARETNAYSIWCTKEGNCDNRSFVDRPIATLGDGLKMTVTRWSLLVRFFLVVVTPFD
ncbi:hypothetical protein AVEN_241106-1, partial [Araneus ventricosus]